MQELDEKCENRKKIPTKRLALAGILLAAALVLSLVESLIPPIIPAAGEGLRENSDKGESLERFALENICRPDTVF